MLRIEEVNKNNFKDIPASCRGCLYWQTTGVFDERMLKPEMEKKKLEWFNNVAKRFGSSMKIAYLDNAPVGFMQYAPPEFFPRTKEYAAGPLSEDAVFIACLYISQKDARGKGSGTVMLRDLLAELKKKECKAVETFARKSSQDNPSGPLRFYLKHGFKVEREKDDFPLVRLEL